MQKEKLYSQIDLSITDNFNLNELDNLIEKDLNDLNLNNLEKTQDIYEDIQAFLNLNPLGEFNDSDHSNINKKSKYVTEINEFDRQSLGLLPIDEIRDISKDFISSPLRKVVHVFLFILELIFYVFSFIFVLASILYAYSETPGNSLFGYKFYNVSFSSMIPTLEQGDLIIVKAGPSSIDSGDVVTFESNGAMVSHRVARLETEYDGIAGDYIVTRGDANNFEDNPIPRSQVSGKVLSYVPGMGNMIGGIQKLFIPIILGIGIALAALIVLRIYRIKKRRNIT